MQCNSRDSGLGKFAGGGVNVVTPMANAICAHVHNGSLLIGPPARANRTP